MSKEKYKIFCSSGGCAAKLGPKVLSKILGQIPKVEDKNLLIGYESSDDAAVYQLTDDLAMVQTLDFFPPMVEDPYIFGQIAATNALSDIYAMGGQVKTSLNIVCFPEDMDTNILGQILLGGSEKVQEAGGVLVGGHSISDKEIKYGLSVTGIIHPKKIYANNSVKKGDKLLLTKPLGVGIVTTANRLKEASKESMDMAIKSMTTLNKYAAEIVQKYNVHGCTDITGFGFLAHLKEMLGDKFSAIIDINNIPYIKESYHYAEEFFLTGAGQRNRNHVGDNVEFNHIPFPMEEILFDPQTSGGLLISMLDEDAEKAYEEIVALGLPCGIVGEIVEKREKSIYVV